MLFSKRCVNGPYDSILERISRPKPGHCDMFLSEIGIDRSFTGQGCRKILDVTRRCTDLSTIRLSNSNIIHGQVLGRGTVRKDHLSEAFEAGLALDLDSNKK